MEEVKAVEAFLTLVVKGEESVQNAAILRVEQPLEEEFKDLAPVELLTGLPPMRDIQHHIDLVLDAILPNLPYFCMSLEEHNILQDQVEDHIRK